MSRRKPDLATLELGPLSVEVINVTLQLELDEGVVVLTANAQRHALRRHPVDYPRCLPHVAAVVQYPQWIGDDLRNPGTIELIAHVPALGSGLLVAVHITRDDLGRYEVRSFYPVSREKIDGRFAKGFLKRAPIRQRPP